MHGNIMFNSYQLWKENLSLAGHNDIGAMCVECNFF